MQALFGRKMQRPMPLDAEDFGPHAAEHRGLVTAARADLQHLVARPNGEQLCLERHGIGL